MENSLLVANPAADRCSSATPNRKENVCRPAITSN